MSNISGVNKTGINSFQGPVPKQQTGSIGEVNKVEQLVSGLGKIFDPTSSASATAEVNSVETMDLEASNSMQMDLKGKSSSQIVDEMVQNIIHGNSEYKISLTDQTKLEKTIDKLPDKYRDEIIESVMQNTDSSDPNYLGTINKKISKINSEAEEAKDKLVTAKTNALVNGYVDDALKIAADNKNGYSQPERTAKHSYDCASLVARVLQKEGFDKDIIKLKGSDYNATNFYTGNEGERLKALGFEETNYTGSKNLKKGDILTKPGHTEIYIGKSKNVGAHSNYDGKTGDSNGREIRVDSVNNSAWTKAYRYTGKGVKLTKSEVNNIYKTLLEG